MIKAEELRIGNWVRNKFDKEEPIQSVQDFFDQYPVKLINSQQAENFEPIAITPEILEKAGFTNNNNFFVYKDYSLLRDMGGWHFDYIDADCRGERAIAYPNYLHQLQNLVFALTGEELEIKL